MSWIMSSERIVDSSHTTALTPAIQIYRVGIFSDNDTIIFLWLVIAVFCQMIIVFGISSNIINIICFVKQGFKDSVNISLLGLAISDFCSLAPMMMINVCFTPSVLAADLPMDTREYQYLTGSIPHTTFTRITACITALITLERCLCIASPLKVKQIITPTRMKIIITAVFIILVISMAPIYIVNKIGTKFFPARNRTLLGLVYTEEREQVEKISFAVNNTAVLFSAFIIIIVCTLTLVIQLRQKNAWRVRSSTAEQMEKVTSRNQRVAKMVVMISSLFIACFIPMTAVFIAMSLVPEISIVGRYRNSLTIMGGICYVLEAINSSMNVLIYYHMSSKYRDTFRNLFLKFRLIMVKVFACT